MKNKEFHQPFLPSLILIACFTIVSMILAPVFIDSYINLAKKNQEFTTHKSQDDSDSGNNQLIQSNIK
jgi:hypothetical protein